MNLGQGIPLPLRKDRQVQRTYFSGKLPDAFAYWEPVAAGFGDRDLVEGVWRVRINPSLAGWQSVAKLVLLHARVDAKLHPYRKYGRRFKAEMLRLWISIQYRHRRSQLSEAAKTKASQIRLHIGLELFNGAGRHHRLCPDFDRPKYECRAPVSALELSVLERHSPPDRMDILI